MGDLIRAMPISAADSTTMTLLVILALGLAVGSMVWGFRRGEVLLDRWAARHGYRIVEREYRWVAKGPFFFRSGKGHSVYRITVSDRDGTTRRGYARCGGWFLGLLSDHVDVRWDEDTRERAGQGFPVILTGDRSRGDGSAGRQDED